MDCQLADILKCPVCWGIPKTKIYQCRNGHIICRKCSSGLTDCPQCRIPFDFVKIRSRASEAIIDLKFDCPNRESGCKKRISLKERESHESKCKYKFRSHPTILTQRGLSVLQKPSVKDFSNSFINICQALGHNCKFSSKMLVLDKVIKHLSKHHNVPTRTIATASQEEVRYENFLTTFRSQPPRSSFEAPLIIRLSGEDHGPVFMICYTTTSGSDPCLSGHCILLNDSSYQASKYTANFFIESPNGDFPELEWNLKAVGLLHASVVLQTSPFRNPLSLLKQYIHSNGRMTIRFSISKEKLASPIPQNPELNAERENSTTNWSFGMHRKSCPDAGSSFNSNLDAQIRNDRSQSESGITSKNVGWFLY